MPAKIRVFVSSTMDDLANEREAVVEAIESLNFEPVNAESILPLGNTSWQALEPEISSSHICILILGERYGWMPTEGFGADQGKSVTHLEIDAARAAGIPILPFFKRLKYAADSTSEDAVRRDKFRKEIADWKDGLFRGEFNLASDLKKMVFQTLLDVLKDSYLRSAVDSHISKVPVRSSTEFSFEKLPKYEILEDATLPSEVLFAGAGMSLSAGYPSANALSGVVGNALGLDQNQTARHSLAQLFEFAEIRLGSNKLREIIVKTLNPPLPVEPTPAHVAAVRRFPVILTTNYDRLFEQACEMLRIPYRVRMPGRTEGTEKRPTVQIFKIDGSIKFPDSLVLSSEDSVKASLDAAFWSDIESILASYRPIVIGHSMRDAASLRLMQRRNSDLGGFYVAPAIDPVDGRLLLDRLNLIGVESSASDYLWKPQQ